LFYEGQAGVLRATEEKETEANVSADNFERAQEVETPRFPEARPKDAIPRVVQ